jgi:hypothetical protein
MLKLVRNLVLATRFRKTRNLDLNLGRIELSDAELKYDFELTDRYQNFSSEVLRLSLIGIGVYAFLLKEVGGFSSTLKASPSGRWFSVASIFLFALATACSLVHRYYSSDSMAVHIRYLRLKKVLSHGTNDENVALEASHEKSERNAMFQLCEVMIGCSAASLGLGTAFLAVSLLKTLL